MGVGVYKNILTNPPHTKGFDGVGSIKNILTNPHTQENVFMEGGGLLKDIDHPPHSHKKCFDGAGVYKNILTTPSQYYLGIKGWGI